MVYIQYFPLPPSRHSWVLLEVKAQPLLCYQVLLEGHNLKESATSKFEIPLK